MTSAKSDDNKRESHVRRDYSDLPIDAPDQDLFGFDPFTRALARSLREMRTPHGVAIALNGPWGAGKSSAVNLLRYNLAATTGPASLQVTSFNPWWFRGEEALVLAFFRELYAAMKPSLGKQALEAIPQLGARLLKGTSMISPVADALGAHGAGTIAAGAMQWLSGLIQTDESIEKLHGKLAKALAEQGKRFIVVIDDIDRLAPDEALAVFRLVKSVGRLPNVAYLLAFDRALAERMVAEKFPSEGPHYLEKIVQASFDLPLPSQSELRRQLEVRLFEDIERPVGAAGVHAMNLLFDIVAPEITTPRHLVRYLNAVSITWPAVAGEVSLGDFLALEAYRLFRPDIYRAVRANQSLVCGPATSSGARGLTRDALDRLLLCAGSNDERVRRGLMRLFPKLESIWSNYYHRSDVQWAQERRVCSFDHFPTYFRLAPGDNVVTRSDLNELLARAVAEPGQLAQVLVAAASSPRRDGGTRAASLLAALTIEASKVSVETAERVLSEVFKVADDLDIEADEAGAFSIGDNRLRIHWLMRALLWDRTDVSTRSAILNRCAASASLGWLVDLASSSWDRHQPRPGEEEGEPRDLILDEATTARLVKNAIRAIKCAARDGSLIEHRRLAHILYRWRELAQDDGKSVRRWTNARLAEDVSLTRLAAAFTTTSWSQTTGLHGIGDLVATGHDSAHVDRLGLILDRRKFRTRLEKLTPESNLAAAEFEAVERFLTAWRAAEQRPRSF